MAVLPGFRGVNEALSGIFGSEGFLFQIIPGGMTVLLIAGVIIAIELVRRYHEEGTSKRFWQEFAALAIISLVTFGDASIIVLITLIVIGVTQLSKYREERAERLSPAERGIDLSQYGQVEQRAEAAETTLRQEFKNLSKELRAEFLPLLHATREKHFENTFTAAQSKLSQDITTMLQIENIETKEIGQIMQALQTIGTDFANHLQTAQITTMEQVEELGKKVLTPNFNTAVQLTGRLAADERKANQTRFKFIASLSEDIEAILDVTKKSKNMNRQINKLEQKLVKKIGQETINKVRSELTRKRNTLKTLKKEIGKMYSIKADTDEKIKETYKGQVAALENEIAQLQQLLQRLQNMQTSLSNAVKEIQRTTEQIRIDIAQVIAAEEPAKQHLTKLTSFSKPLSDADKTLTETVKGLRDTIKEIQKAESAQQKLAEESIIKASTSMGKTFTAIETIQKTDQQMHEKATKPLIEQMLNLMATSQILNEHMKTLLDQIYEITIEIHRMSVAAEKLVKGAATGDEKLIEVMYAAHQIMHEEENARAQLAQRTTQSLNQSKTAIDQHITYLEQLMERARSVEKQLLDGLSNMLNIIVQKKTEISQEFQQTAQRFQAQMANVQQAREQPTLKVLPGSRAPPTARAA